MSAGLRWIGCSAMADFNVAKKDEKTRRKHLNDYSDAAREIEVAGIAVDVLEKLRFTPAVDRCIKLLQAGQQRQLKKLDAAATKLGAPYPKA